MNDREMWNQYGHQGFKIRRELFDENSLIVCEESEEEYPKYPLSYIISDEKY